MDSFLNFLVERIIWVINGLLVIPARNAIIWIAFAVVIGMILGGMFFWLKRKSSPPTKET